MTYTKAHLKNWAQNSMKKTHSSPATERKRININWRTKRNVTKMADNSQQEQIKQRYKNKTKMRLVLLSLAHDIATYLCTYTRTELQSIAFHLQWRHRRCQNVFIFPWFGGKGKQVLNRQIRGCAKIIVFLSEFQTFQSVNPDSFWSAFSR